MKTNPAIHDFDWLPERIGKYRIEKILGMGGMGVIYKALQEPLNRVVALKVLLPAAQRTRESSMRFELEAKAISLLQHHNIVNIYEYGQEGEYRYFAMQFVDGEDLGRKIKGLKPMAFSELIDISKQICRGLRYAHAHSVIHRDIKPQNVLIESNGLVLLTDFGIARIFSDSNITMTGVAVGTPEYMSPEQAEGLAPDAQTDIYSLGVLMYEMATSEPPFTGKNAVSIAYKQVHELPPPPSAKRKDIPKRLELIILKALKKDKKERYGSAEEVLEHLDSVDVEEKVHRSTVPLLSRKRSHETQARSEYIEKRITDRRSGDRRNRGTDRLAAFKPWTLGFWVESLRSQLLSLSLILVLALLFVYHIVKHH